MATRAGVAPHLLRDRDHRRYRHEARKGADDSGGPRPGSERYVAIPVGVAGNPGNARPAGPNGFADQAAAYARCDQTDNRQRESGSAPRTDLRRPAWIDGETQALLDLVA